MLFNPSPKALVAFMVLIMPGLYESRRAPLARRPRDVATTSGLVRGYRAPNPPHFAYFGIPYSRPLSLADRFKAPQPPEAWDGIFEATHKVKCPQPSGEGDVNCLVLNIFVPERANRSTVVVQVHGGEFTQGWGSFKPPNHLLEEGFVVVTFNYRLGALGFLCLGIENAPGNVGPKDQLSALQWVSDNIEHFQGDPKDITLFASGSGAASVQILLLYGSVEKYITKIILESGSLLSPLSMTYDPLALAFDAVTSIGYECGKSAHALAQCFKEIPTKQLTKIPVKFMHCVESDPLTGLVIKDPILLVNEKVATNGIPVMIVYKTKEFIPLIEEPNSVNENLEKFEKLLPNNLQIDNKMVREKVASLVKALYFNDNEPFANLRTNYDSYFNEVLVEYPIIKFAVSLAKLKYVVYLMELAAEEHRECDAEDINVFGCLLRETKTETHLKGALNIWTLVNNFLKLGDPTPLITSKSPLIWQPLDPYLQKTTRLKIGDTMSTGKPSSLPRLVFWDEHVYSFFYKIHLPIQLH